MGLFNNLASASGDSGWCVPLSDVGKHQKQRPLLNAETVDMKPKNSEGPRLWRAHATVQLEKLGHPQTGTLMYQRCQQFELHFRESQKNDAEGAGAAPGRRSVRQLLPQANSRKLPQLAANGTKSSKGVLGASMLVWARVIPAYFLRN